MGLYYITFRSVTFAQRGETLLLQRNLRVSMMRAPRWMEEQGCGYALKLWTADLPSVLRVLQENRIQWRKVYALRKDGEMEEIRQ